MDRTQIPFESILRRVNLFDVKNNKKWRFSYWGYALKRDFIDVYTPKNDEYTPENDNFFFEKTMKAYFKAVILSIKTYENILKFIFLIPPPPRIYEYTKTPLNQQE